MDAEGLRNFRRILKYVTDVSGGFCAIRTQPLRGEDFRCTSDKNFDTDVHIAFQISYPLYIRNSFVLCNNI